MLSQVGRLRWATSIYDYKAITTDKRAKENLGRFLLALEELLEGRTLDVSKEVIDTLRSLIEDAAFNGKINSRLATKRAMRYAI